MLLSSHDYAFGKFTKKRDGRNAFLELALRGYDLSILHDNEPTAEILKIK